MTHSEGFFPPDYESPLPVPDGSSTKVDGVPKNWVPESSPLPADTKVDGVPVDWVTPADSLANLNETTVDGVFFGLSRDGHDSPSNVPGPITASINGVPMSDTHDQPNPAPDGGAWTLTPS